MMENSLREELETLITHEKTLVRDVQLYKSFLLKALKSGVRWANFDEVWYRQAIGKVERMCRPAVKQGIVLFIVILLVLNGLVLLCQCWKIQRQSKLNIYSPVS